MINIKRTRSFSIILLILISLSMIINLIITAVAIPVVSQYITDITNDPNNAADLFMNMLLAIQNATAIPSTLNYMVTIPLIVFQILTIVQARKIKTNKTPFILLIIGLFVTVVALVGVILLLVELKKHEQEPADRYDTQTGEPL